MIKCGHTKYKQAQKQEDTPKQILQVKATGARKWLNQRMLNPTMNQEHTCHASPLNLVHKNTQERAHTVSTDNSDQWCIMDMIHLIVQLVLPIKLVCCKYNCVRVSVIAG